MTGNQVKEEMDSRTIWSGLFWSDADIENEGVTVMECNKADWAISKRVGSYRVVLGSWDVNAAGRKEVWTNA
jgi:hypothetical protein